MKGLSGSDFHQEEDLARGGIITNRKINDMKEFIDLLTKRGYEILSYN